MPLTITNVLRGDQFRSVLNMRIDPIIGMCRVHWF